MAIGAAIAGAIATSVISNSMNDSGPSATNQNLPTFSPEEQERINKFINSLGGSVGQQGGGAGSVPFSNEIGAYLTQRMQQAANKVGPLSDFGKQYAQSSLRGFDSSPTAGEIFSGFRSQNVIPELVTRSLEDLQTRGPTDINDVFQANVYNPLTEQFNEDILPDIASKYAPSGFYSSERVRSQNLAREDLLQKLSDARANYVYEATESDLNRKLQAAGAQGTLNTNMLNSAVNEASTQRQYLASVLGLIPELEASELNALSNLTPLYDLEVQKYLGDLSAETNMGIAELQALTEALLTPASENVVTVNPGSTRGERLGAIVGEGISDSIGGSSPNSPKGGTTSGAGHANIGGTSSGSGGGGTGGTGGGGSSGVGGGANSGRR